MVYRLKKPAAQPATVWQKVTAPKKKKAPRPAVAKEAAPRPKMRVGRRQVHGIQTTKTLDNLSPCVQAYALATVDPHALLGRPSLPCIPDANSQPSFKFSSRSRFEFTIGPGGVGGVAVWPWRMAANNPIVCPWDGARIAQQATFTDGTYAGTGAEFANDAFLVPPGAGTKALATTNSMFNAADFGSGLEPGGNPRGLRLVGSGIRVGYTGAVTNQSGTVTFIRNNATTARFNGASDDLSELLDMNTAVRINVRDMSPDNMNGVSYAPVIVSDFDYVTAPYSATGLAPNGADDNEAIGRAPTNRMAYVALVTGATPGSVFTADVLSFFEATGPRLPLTASDSDPTGFAGVTSARSAARPGHNPGVSAREVVRSAVNIIARGSGMAVRAATKVLVAGLSEGVGGAYL